MAAIATWIGQLAVGYRERAERRPLPGLAACHWNGSNAVPDKIHNISASGVYLETDARWPKHALLSLTLRLEEQRGNRTGQCVSLLAKVVRRDRRGVALSFVFPSGLDISLWESPLKSSHRATEPADVIREFRLAKAMAFLCSICPSAVERLRRLMRGELSSYRVLGAAEIALRAEAMMAIRSAQPKPDADPAVVLRILTDGSWTDDGQRMNMCAGLLSVACADSGRFALHEVVHAMSQLTAAHARLLQTACKCTDKLASEDGVISALPFYCTTEEIIALAETHDLHRIDRDLDHMAEIGLFVRRKKSRFFVAIDDTTMTPSQLGLELYARSRGYCGSLSDFYSVAFAGESIVGAMN